MKKKAALLIGLLLIAAGTAITQLFTPGISPAAFVPQGAIVYAEAQKGKDLLTWWRDSEVRSRWEQSANYHYFETSRLYLKLQDRLGSIGSEAAFQFDLDTLVTATSGRTAVALYDIGELRAVALTEISQPEAEASRLWASRKNFREKSSGGITYFVEPQQGRLSFAYAKPYLVVATNEALLRDTLRNTQSPDQSLTLDSGAKWKNFENVRTGKAAVTLFLDQEALQKNRYFRRYWIQQNVEDFNDILATWIEIDFQDSEITERRYFSGVADQQKEPALHVWSEPLRNSRYELVSVASPGDAKNIAAEMTQMINRFPADYRNYSHPPRYTAAADRAMQADSKSIFSQNIDEPIAQSESEQVLNANQPDELAAILQTSEPILAIQGSYPLWDTRALFVQFETCIAVRLNSFDRLDQTRFLALLNKHFQVLVSTQDRWFRWHETSAGRFVLPAVQPLYVHFAKPWVLISNQEKETDRMTSILPATLPPSGVYRFANWRTGRWKYSRLMKRLDYEFQAEANAGDTGPENILFFSRNIDSLLYALDNIEASSVDKSPSMEIVRYKLKQ